MGSKKKMSVVRSIEHSPIEKKSPFIDNHWMNSIQIAYNKIVAHMLRSSILRL